MEEAEELMQDPDMKELAEEEYYSSKEQLPKLDGCQVHTTVMLSEVDTKIFKKLGIDFTSEPVKKKRFISYH